MSDSGGLIKALTDRGLSREAGAEGLARHERHHGEVIGSSYQSAKLEGWSNDAAEKAVRDSGPTPEEILNGLADRLSRAIRGNGRETDDEADWDAVGSVMHDLRALAEGRAMKGPA